ncbi:MAG: type II toxin-antitoxin system VapC family toxin [Pseudomonadota bacterium]
MTGLDTGYFIMLLEGNEKAGNIWQSLLDGEDDAVVSCLTLFELERLSLKGKIARNAMNILHDGIGAVCLIAWMNDTRILLSGAKLSHSFGTPAMDSLILAGFKREGVSTIYTTDSDMEKYGHKGVKVINLRRGP